MTTSAPCSSTTLAACVLPPAFCRAWWPAGLHLQAGARGHPAGHLRPGAARLGAARGADRDEHHVQNVPGLVSGQGGEGGGQGGQAETVSRGGGAAGDDAGDPFLNVTRLLYSAYCGG